MMTGDDLALPDSCGIALKEWDVVCAALASGRQSLILRKGGIDEAAGGFAPEHTAFWLYPTRVHQDQQGVKPGEAGPSLLEGVQEREIPIEYLAVVGLIGRVERLEDLSSLDSSHIWTEETVEKRFHYRRPGLWVIGVRVYRAASERLPVTPEFLGCKSWVPLGVELPAAGIKPVLSDPEYRASLNAIRAALSFTAGS